MPDPHAPHSPPPPPGAVAPHHGIDATTLALQVREAQLRGIFDSASDAIVTANAQQHIVMANRSAAALFGLPLDRLIGSPLSSLVPERFRAAHAHQVDRFGEHGVSARHMGLGVELSALRADGTEFPIDAAISHVHIDGQRLFTVIVRDVTERRAAERRLRDSQERLEASHAVLRRLVSAQDRIQENERRRIARELHDDLQQTLATIGIEVATLRADKLPGAVDATLARIDALVATAIESTRRIVQDLRPQTLEELGLEPALRALADRFVQQTGIACALSVAPNLPDDARPVSDDTATCLYRVAQEALNNIVKHAGARHVQIELAAARAADGSGPGLVLRISDDGRGLRQADRHKPDSFGLVGMRERVLALGGLLRVSSEPGRGTTLEAEIPG